MEATCTDATSAPPPACAAMGSRAARADRREHHAPRCHHFAALLLACALGAESTHGYEIVHDPVTMARALQEYAAQARRWTDTVRQYQQQLDHYQQQLISLKRLRLPSSSMTNMFDERPDFDGLEDACPGTEPGRVAGMLNRMAVIAPSKSQSLAEEQRVVCARVVMAQNNQYNASVRMIKRLVERNNAFKAIEAQRDRSGTAQGALAANDNEIQRFVARNAMDLDHWQAQMKAYDIYIAALLDQQARLSRRALDGNGSVLGQMVQAATLAAALNN